VVAVGIGWKEVVQWLPVSLSEFSREMASKVEPGYVRINQMMQWSAIYNCAFGPDSTVAIWFNALTYLTIGVVLVIICHRWGRDDAEGWVLAAMVMVSLGAAYHRYYDGVFVFILAAVFWNTFRTQEGRRNLSMWLLGGALLFFLHLFSIQPILQRGSRLLKAFPAMAPFYPVYSWLTLALLVLTLWLAYTRAHRTAAAADRVIAEPAEART
jgi:hypothetical protein